MINLTTLPNGVRVITEAVPYVESASIGIWVEAGAKNEETAEFGMSHFLEHMLFKGTPTRTAKDIADQVAGIGGQINAATDREYTTYYIRVLKEFIPLSLDILTDMLLNSTFDADELGREKDVIAEEIRRHEDMPEDMVHEVIAQKAWGDHPLGHGVLGSEETVRAVSSDSMRSYLTRNYTPERIVLSAAGNLDHQQVVDLAEKTLGTMDNSGKAPTYEAASHHTGQQLIAKETEAAYFCFAMPGLNELDERKYVLAMLDVILGGGMSSRLFQEVREKRGLAYDIGTYRMGYREGGLFNIYGGTGVETLSEVLSVVHNEMEKIRTEKVPEEEFVRAKNLIRGALLLAQESMGSRMSRMGRSLLDYGKLMTVKDVLAKIEAVTREDIIELAEYHLKQDNVALAVIGPGEDVEKALQELGQETVL